MLTAKQYLINTISALGIVAVVGAIAKFVYNKPLDFRVILILPVIYFGFYTWIDKMKARTEKDSDA